MKVKGRKKLFYFSFVSDCSEVMFGDSRLELFVVFVIFIFFFIEIFDDILLWYFLNKVFI